MHEHAEHGVPRTGPTKEAGAQRLRRRERRQRLRCQQVAGRAQRPCCANCSPGSATSSGHPARRPVRRFEDRIRFTPQARGGRDAGRRRHRLRLPLHTDLGHRCRGARVDGAMVPLNKPLQNGQNGRDHRSGRRAGLRSDWLNAEVTGLFEKPRSRPKVRAWFNALAQRRSSRAGARRSKLLQRERTALNVRRPGCNSWVSATPTRCSRWSAKGTSCRCATSRTCCANRSAADARQVIASRRLQPTQGDVSGGGVLVVGVESLLTTLAAAAGPRRPTRSAAT